MARVSSTFQVRPSMSETTALGAAMAAGSAEGINVWDINSEDYSKIISDVFEPKITQHGEYITTVQISHHFRVKTLVITYCCVKNPEAYNELLVLVFSSMITRFF